MKRESRGLLQRAVDSLFLSVEAFNRPYDRGRHDAVLIFMDRAFELLLKAVIVEKGGKIREGKSKETIGFSKCVQKCVSDSKLKVLSEEEALSIQSLNSLRDAAQHYFLDISEDLLFVTSQSGVTLFEKILKNAFGKDLREEFPERVLLITRKIPKNLDQIVGMEFEQVKQLIAPGSRKQVDAKGKLRGLAILESSIHGERTQPSDRELDKLVKKIREGKSWSQIFPGIASIDIDTEGTGLNVSIHLTKKSGDPIHLVGEDDPNASVMAVKRVNELDYYSLGAKDLAKRVLLSEPKMRALIWKFELKKDPEYYKEIKVGKTIHKRYSSKIIPVLKGLRKTHSLEDVWSQYKKRNKS